MARKNDIEVGSKPHRVLGKERKPGTPFYDPYGTLLPPRTLPAKRRGEMQRDLYLEDLDKRAKFLKDNPPPKPKIEPAKNYSKRLA
jgi:hypothetical protein